MWVPSSLQIKIIDLINEMPIEDMSSLLILINNEIMEKKLNTNLCVVSYSKYRELEEKEKNYKKLIKLLKQIEGEE